MDGKVFKGCVGHQELAAWVEAVSYTHLDVYKRQIYHVAELTKADRRRCLGDTEQPAEKAQR